MRGLFHKTYYVNLGRRPDRRTRAEQQLERLGCERFERFEAIDAEQLQTDEWVRRGAIVADAPHSSAIQACIASHYSIWKAIVDSDARDDEWFLILEDDFLPHPLLLERPDVWRAYWGALPPDAGFVFVGCIRWKDDQLLDVGEPLNRFVVRLKIQVFSSHAYAVTKQFVREHLAQLFPLEFPMDYFFFKLEPLYALRSIDPEFWDCTTPDSFYRIAGDDEGQTLHYAGLISVYPSSSDIQYARPGVINQLNSMLQHMHRGEHESVRDMAAAMKPSLMKELYPDLYLSFLDICITSFWHVEQKAGERYVRQLLETARTHPVAQGYVRDSRERLVQNLRRYSPHLGDELEQNCPRS